MSFDFMKAAVEDEVESERARIYEQVVGPLVEALDDALDGSGDMTAERVQGWRAALATAKKEIGER